MELRTVVLFALVAGGFSVPLSSVTDDQCSRHCTESNVLDYRIGRTYRYRYDAKTTTQLVGTDDDTSGLEIAATVDLEVLSKCELVLRLSDVDLKEASRQALMVTSSNKREFQRALERHPLRFSFQDGIIPEICPSAEEEPWVVNIKRGILSALQNSYLSQRRTDMEETDVTGSCDVQYEAVDERGLTTQYKRTRTFQRCSDRRLGSETGIQANFYNKQSERPHILDSNQECTHTIDSNSVIESVTCTERHLLRPFSHGQNGATVRSTQTLQLTPQRPRTKSSLLSGLGFTRSDLRFEHNSRDSQSASWRVEQTLRDLCAQTAQGVRPETPALFSQLVYQMRDMNVQELRSTVARAEGICNSDPEKMKKFAMDAIPLVHNEASARLVKEYIMKGEVTGEQADAWLASQVFAKNPTPQMIAELQPLCEGREVRRSAFLSLSALIHKYCQAESDCAQRPEIRNALAVFERNLGEKCHSFSDKEEEKMMMSLKAIGNAGQAVSAAPTLSQCVLTEANPIPVRRAAMEAFRRLPCSVPRTALTNTFLNREEDSEVRIAAYIQAALCPSHDFFKIVKRALNTEESSQVGSYVWSNLQQVLKRDDEWRNTVSDILRNPQLEKKFTGDKRKFSSAWEGSVFSDRWNLGGEAQADVIFSDTSFLPRSARLNLTAMVFGAEMNMLEIGGRIEGLSYLAESFFGHQGYFPENNVLHLLKTKKEKRSVLKENKLEEVHRKFNAKQEHQPEGSYYVRMYGDEIQYGDFKGLDIRAHEEGWNVMEIMMKLAKQQDYEVTKSTMFLDSTHTVPTSTGLPLRLAINGTATTHVKVSGKMDMRNMGFSPRSMHIEGQVMPSAAVEIASEMGIDAHVARCGMKMVTTLHSSTFADGKIILKKGSDLEVKLNMPRDKMEIVNVQSKVFLINQDQEYEVRGVQTDRVDESACTGTWGIETFGLQMCGEVQYPNPRLEDETPYMPLTGPMSASVTLNKADAGLDSYVMEASYNIKPSRVNGKKENTYSVHFLLDTPGSRINRKMELNAGLNIAGKAVELSMQHPKKSLTFNGNYNDQAETKSVNLDLTLDQKDQYSLKGEMMVEELQGSWRYMPSLEIKVPQMKTITANGVVGYEQDRKAELTLTLSGIKSEDIVLSTSMEKTLKNDKKSYSLDMQMKYPEIIDASLDAELEGKDNVFTHVFKVDYSLFDQKKETIEMNQRLRRDVRKYVGSHDFKFSCFPDFNHKLSINHENTLTMAKSSMQLDYGKSAFRENNLKRLILSSEITDGSDRSKYMYDTELKVEHPEQGIDGELSFHHQHSKGLITDLNTRLSVTYDKEKEPVLVQITYKNDAENNNNLMKMGGGLTLFTPMTRMRFAEDIEETSSMEYKAVSTIQLEQGAQWQVDKTLKWHEAQKEGSIRVFVPNSDEQTLFRAASNFDQKIDGFTVHGEMETIQTPLSSVDLVFTNKQDKYETNLHLKVPQIMEVKNDFVLDNSELKKSVSMNTQWTEPQQKQWVGVDVHGSMDIKDSVKEQRRVVNVGVSQKQGSKTRQMDVNADVYFTPDQVFGGEVSFEHKGNDKTNKLYKTVVNSRLSIPESKLDLTVEQPYDCDICEGLKMPKKVNVMATTLSQDKSKGDVHFRMDCMVDDTQPITLEYNGGIELMSRTGDVQMDTSLEFRHGLKLPEYLSIPRQMSLTGMYKSMRSTVNIMGEFCMHENQKVIFKQEYKAHRHHTGFIRREMTIAGTHSIPDFPLPSTSKIVVKIDPKSLEDVAFKTEVSYGQSAGSMDITYKGKNQRDWTHDVTIETAHTFDVEVPRDMKVDFHVERKGLSGEGKLEFSSKTKRWTASLEGKSDNTISEDGSFNVGMDLTFLHAIPEMLEVGVPAKVELTNQNELKWGVNVEYQTTLELKYSDKFFKQQIDYTGPNTYEGRHELHCVYTHFIEVAPKEYRMDAIIERDDPFNYMEDFSVTWDGRKQYHLVRKMAHTVENGNDVYTFTESVNQPQPLNVYMPNHDSTTRLVLDKDFFPQEYSMDFNYVDENASKKNFNTKITYEGPLPNAFQGHHELHFTMNHPWDVPVPKVSSVDWTIDSDEERLYDSRYTMKWDGKQMILNKLVRRSQVKRNDVFTVSFDMEQPFDFLPEKSEGSAVVQLDKLTKFPSKITCELKGEGKTYLDMQTTYDGPLPVNSRGHHELRFTLTHAFDLPVPKDMGVDWIVDVSQMAPYVSTFTAKWDGKTQFHLFKSFKITNEEKLGVFTVSTKLEHPFDFLPSPIEASGRLGLAKSNSIFREFRMDLKMADKRIFETEVKMDGNSPTEAQLTVRVNQYFISVVPAETLVELSQEVTPKFKQSIKITLDKAKRFEASRDFERKSSGYTHNIKVNLPAIRIDEYGRQQVSFDIEHEDKMEDGERNIKGSVSFRHPFTTYVPFRDMASSYDLKQTYRTVQGTFSTNWDNKDGVQLEVKYNNKTLGSTNRYDSSYTVTQPFFQPSKMQFSDQYQMDMQDNQMKNMDYKWTTAWDDTNKVTGGYGYVDQSDRTMNKHWFYNSLEHTLEYTPKKMTLQGHVEYEKKGQPKRGSKLDLEWDGEKMSVQGSYRDRSNNRQQDHELVLKLAHPFDLPVACYGQLSRDIEITQQLKWRQDTVEHYTGVEFKDKVPRQVYSLEGEHSMDIRKGEFLNSQLKYRYDSNPRNELILATYVRVEGNSREHKRKVGFAVRHIDQPVVSLDSTVTLAARKTDIAMDWRLNKDPWTVNFHLDHEANLFEAKLNSPVFGRGGFEMRMDEDEQSKTYFMEGTSNNGDALFFKTQIFPEQKKIVFRHGHTVDSKEESLDIVMKYVNETAVSMEIYETEAEQRTQTFSEVVLRLVTPEILASKIYYNPKTPEIVEDRLNDLIARFMQHHFTVADNFRKAFDKETREWMSSASNYGCTGTYFQLFIQKLRPAVLGDRKSVAAPTLEQLRKEYGISGVSRRVMYALNTAADTVRQTYNSAVDTVMKPVEDLKNYIEENLMNDMYQRWEGKMDDMSFSLRSKLTDGQREMLDRNEVQKSMYVMKNIAKEVGTEVMCQMRKNWQRSMGVLPLPMMKTKIHQLNLVQGRIAADLHLPFKWHSFESMPQPYAQMVDMWENQIKPMANYSPWDTFYRYKPSSYSMVPPFMADALISGKQHFLTFDKKHFEFGGDCSYVLARDMIDGNFSVVLNYHSGSELQKKSLVVIIDEKTYEIFPTGMMKRENQDTELPLQDKNTVIRRDAQRIVVENSNGVAVTCDLTHDLCNVQVSGWYFGKTAGLFGIYNNEKNDEFTMSDGTKTQDLLQFTSSWDVSKSCRRNRNKARTCAPGPQDSRAEQVCAQMFKDQSSPLRRCFNIVDVTPFHDMCKSDVCEDPNSVNPSTLPCKVTAAYIEQCRKAGVPLNMPSKCVTCQNPDGSVFHEGEQTRITDTRKVQTADIVVVVEEKTCNRRRAPQLTDLVQYLDTQLQRKGMKDNRFALVGYGGEGVHDASHTHTISGQLFHDARQFVLGVEKLEFGEGQNNDAFSSLRMAADYPFRTGAAKSIVILSCSEECQETQGDYKEISTMLKERDITVHLLKDHRFRLRKTKDIERVTIYGLDRREVFTSKDVSRDFDKSSLLQYVKAPKDMCSALALETEGCIFDSNSINNKEFLDVYSRRVSGSVRPAPCQVCDCVQDNWGAPRSVCRKCDDSFSVDIPIFSFDESSKQSGPVRSKWWPLF